MNEQLKIVIKAVATDAKKQISEVKKELEGIKKSGKESGKSLGESMKAVAKGAAVAVGAIAAVTAALVALGKSSLEAQREQAKLIAGFQSAGGSAKTAADTYKGLYRFMGDAGAATEAAQSLARITTNSKDLAQWVETLQGVYARAGAAIPVESLAEAANETAQVAKITGTMADALNWVGISEDAVNAKLATLNTYQEREHYLRTLLNSTYAQAAQIYERNNQSLLAYNESQLRADTALANTGKVLLPLMTQLNNLSATLLTVLKPAFETVATIISIFVEWIVVAIKWVAAFFSIFTGGSKTVKTAASDIDKVAQSTKKATNGATGISGALNKATQAAKELKKQTSGFDELNILQSTTSAASASGGADAGGGGGAAIEVPDFSSLEQIELPELDSFNQGIEEMRGKLEGFLVLIGSIALAWAAFSLAEHIGEILALEHGLDILSGKARIIGGYFVAIAGAILLVKGYCDAWVNGIDWANFATILGGAALLITGIAMTFGGINAAIVGVGVALAGFVLGIVDFIKNGASLQNILMIIIGLLGIFAAVWYAATLPVALIVTAIAAVVGGFILLWNNCEGFRNFWIGLWEAIQLAFGAVVDWIVIAVGNIAQWFVDAWNWIAEVWGVVAEWFAGIWAAIVESLTPLIEAIGHAFVEAWELIKVVWDIVAPWFSAIWEAIKMVFSVVGAVLSGFFSVAWELIKGVWSVVVTHFTLIWENIKAVFSVVATFFGGMFSTAWEAIKAVWNTVVGFFTAIWESIANIFSVVKAVLTGNWQEAWEGIKGIVGAWADFFKGIWESIKNVFSSVGKWFSDTFKAAWEGIKKIFANWGQFFTGLWDNIKQIFSNVGKAIGDAITNTVKSAVNGVLSIACNIINGFIKAINVAIGIINMIPGVNIGYLSELEVPKLAKGGITTGTTMAMIGEAGREAVLPLENNTEWMDALVDKIIERNSAPSKIVLMLNDKELGWANIRSINSITEQTGELPLVIV